MIDEDGLLVSFVEESQQHLQTIEPDLLDLEQGGDSVDPEVLNRIFRSIHSIKRASGFFGLQQIGKLSHIMENLLSLLRDGKISVTQELTDALLAGVDALRAMVEDVANSEEFDISSELSTLEELYDKVSGAPPKTVEVKAKGKAVKEKPSGEKTAEPLLSFKIDEEEIKGLIKSGKYLYSVKLYLKEDLEKKGKTPYDYINSIESLGTFVDSFLDISGISGLSDSLQNDIAFHFIFSTVLDPDLIAVGLEVPEERITNFDLDDMKDVLVTLEKPQEETESRREEEPPEEEKEEKPEAEEEKPEEKPKPGKEKPRPPAKGAATVTKAGRQIQTEEKLRVGVTLLNDLVNLAGELVLGRNQLMEIASPLVKHAPALNSVLQHVSRVTTEMQEKIMQLRMQPVSVIFGKFHRVVRDLSKNLDKEITLETYGEDVELDKSIIEALSDPLTHVIRNSADHGIETPDEREAKGKPRQGKIILKAYHEGGQVHLDIIDDGRGIVPEKVGRKAVEKGLITPEQMESMSDRDLVKLVMKPGFSTAEKVSSVSGRGVGMDVVLTNIEQLGGTVEIDSRVDEGTTIKLILPLTLAIVSGLVIRAWDQVFVLPEVNIDEMVRIKPEEIGERIDRVQDAHILRLRDMLVPLISLRSVLVERTEEEETIDFSGDGGEPLRILILKYGSSRIGLVVDAVENMEEIVVKPLPAYLKKMRCFSGATIMGNGKVALILDIGGILAESSLKGFEERLEEKAEYEEISSEEEIQTLLLFDAGTEERFALPLELITRIESVPVSKIEKIRDRQFLQYQGENLQLICLEDYLPISRPERESTDKIGVIIPKQIKYPMGIVINRVIDTVSTKVELDTTTMMAPGLFGSAVIEGKITLIIDMYRLFEMAAPEWYETEKADVKKTRKEKKRVLLVEDTPFFRMVETEYLESAGYEVVQAEDGERALKILDKQTFDAVVLDILMPVLDGWGVIKAIREDERLKDLPVLAVTSLDDEEVARRGLEAGFDDWEAKLNKTRLLEKLDNIINKKKQ